MAASTITVEPAFRDLGIHVWCGLNDDGQPTITIATEDYIVPEHDGEPLLQVLLNDATLHDAESPNGRYDGRREDHVTSTVEDAARFEQRRAEGAGEVYGRRISGRWYDDPPTRDEL